MGRPKKYQTEEERKAAKAAYMKRWYEKNKAERAAYYQEHKAEKAAYYQDNREAILEQQKQYRAEHKEEIAVYAKQYRAEHNYDAVYRSTPMGRAVNLAKTYKQNDIKYNRGECTIDGKWIVENVFSGQVCHYCGESDWTKLGVDRKDSSLPHTPDNCVPCCAECNTKKGTKSYEEFMDKTQKKAS